MDTKPVISDNELYQLIRNENVEAFNSQRDKSKPLNFRGLDFRNQDLRGMDVTNVDFTDCYFRSADLRGLDLRTCKLDGASMHNARVSGAYFPDNISPWEIRLSIEFGTRMRACAYCETPGA